MTTAHQDCLPKKPYKKPEVTAISLAAEEAVLQTCKFDGVRRGPGAVFFLWCRPSFTPCREQRQS
jgi:hypothetical protein